MKVQCFTVGMFDVNTYLLTDEETGHSAIVDTGEGEQLVDILKKENPNIRRGPSHGLRDATMGHTTVN